jgi:hypothetical protein
MEGKPAPTEAPYMFVARFNFVPGTDQEGMEMYPPEGN